jgi:AbiU2
VISKDFRSISIKEQAMTNVFEQVMGVELGNIFTALTNELSALSAIYDDCIVLFGDGSEDRVALLNSAAPAFFGRTQRAFEHELILGIGRITDPVKSMGKDNLTINRLEELLLPLRPGSVDQLKAKVVAAQDACKFTKDPRNRWLAHRSLDLSTSDPNAKPLDSSTYGKIDSALTALDEVLIAVGLAFNGNGVTFSAGGYRNLPRSRDGGSRSLIRYLK